jgi:HPt (histidine-containing phosphotransfer) domain-containing protein
MICQFENEPLINEAIITELRELDAGSGFMQELVAEFNMQNQRLMKEIVRLAEDCDYESLRFSIHTMKGSSFNVGANRQGIAALAIENACKDEDCETIQQLVPSLVRIAGQTEDSLRILL